MDQVREADVLGAVRYLPDCLCSIMKDHPGEVVVAGGLLRAVAAGELPSDVDVFVPGDRDLALECASHLRDSYDGALAPHASNHAVTVRFTLGGGLPVQFVYRWAYKDPQDLLCRFDFTLSQAATWRTSEGTWCSCASSFFYRDVEEKRLRYCAPKREEDPGESLLRVLKFYRRGYRMSLVDLGRVAARLVEEGDDSSTNFEVAFAERLLRADKSSDVGDVNQYYLRV